LKTEFNRIDIDLIKLTLNSFGIFNDYILLNNYISNDHAAIQISIHTIKDNHMLWHDVKFAALAESISKSPNLYGAAKMYVDSTPTYKKKNKNIKAKMCTVIYNQINSLTFQSYIKICNKK